MVGVARFNSEVGVACLISDVGVALLMSLAGIWTCNSWVGVVDPVIVGVILCWSAPKLAVGVPVGLISDDGVKSLFSSALNCANVPPIEVRPVVSYTGGVLDVS